MEKLLAEISMEAQSSRAVDSDSQYSSEYVLADCTVEAQADMEAGRSTSPAPWNSATDRIHWKQEGAAARCVKQMSDFARRIENSAENSTTWERIGGVDLTRLRFTFRGLLGQILDELDHDAGELREQYEIARKSRNGDIVLAFRFACILSSAIKLGPMKGAARIEVGCSSLSTEFTCFLGKRSAGVTIRKNDNLFALCTNGEWRIEPCGSMPPLGSIKRVMQTFGGQLCTDSKDCTLVKASFPI